MKIYYWSSRDTLYIFHVSGQIEVSGNGHWSDVTLPKTVTLLTELMELIYEG